MRMLGARIYPKIAELLAAERAARQHAFDRLLDDALGKTSGENRFCRPLFDAADIAGMLVVDLLLDLAAGQHRLGGVDDDDVVAAIDVRRVGRLMLAAQPHGDKRGETADDETVGIDHHPLLVDFGGLCRIRFHVRFHLGGVAETTACARLLAGCPVHGQSPHPNPKRSQCTCIGGILLPSCNLRWDGIGGRHVRHQFVVAVGPNADLADRKPLAELDQLRRGDKITRRRFFEKIDGQIGGDGERHPADRGEDGDVHGEIG